MTEIIQTIKKLPVKLLVILILLSIISIKMGQNASYKKEAIFCEDLLSSYQDSTFKNALNDLQSKAWYIYDYTKGIEIYGRGAEISLPLASLTKLMTIRTAIEGGKLDNDVLFTGVDLSPYGDSGFELNDVVKRSELINAGLVASSNDAAYALARSTYGNIPDFINKMNQNAVDLGLKSMSFRTVTGLDEDGIATAYGSPKDVTMLFIKNFIDYPNYFSVSKRENIEVTINSQKTINLSNTDVYLNSLGNILASKTGFTYQAGGNLSILWRSDEGDLIGATVMSSTAEDRFTDMIELQTITNKFLKNYNFLPKSCFKK